MTEYLQTLHAAFGQGEPANTEASRFIFLAGCLEDSGVLQVPLADFVKAARDFMAATKTDKASFEIFLDQLLWSKLGQPGIDKARLYLGKEVAALKAALAASKPPAVKKEEVHVAAAVSPTDHHDVVQMLAVTSALRGMAAVTAKELKSVPPASYPAIESPLLELAEFSIPGNAGSRACSSCLRVCNTEEGPVLLAVLLDGDRGLIATSRTVKIWPADPLRIETAATIYTVAVSVVGLTSS